ncbi:unnamed protein product [Somion occarium]|uniref:Phosphate transporter PHO1 n=1 Tax=Somion occarium TaxID=3059160 RepID=A0ABP1CXW8_9APHY
MKFARYLEETQVPEWKKAYIDYRGLKKRITAIRKAKENRPASPIIDSQIVTTHSAAAGDLQPAASPTSFGDFKDEVMIQHEVMPDALDSPIEIPSPVAICGRTRFENSPCDSSSTHGEVDPSTTQARSFSHPPIHETEMTQRPEHPRVNTLNIGILPRLRRRSIARAPGSLRRTNRGRWELARSTSVSWDMEKNIPMMELLPALNTVQKAFFEKLDAQLDKVETFYVGREKEMKTRVNTLKIQLQELKDHRRLYHEAQQHSSWLPIKIPLIHNTAPLSASRTPSISNPRKRRRYKADDSTSPKGKESYNDSRVDVNKQLEEDVEHLTNGESSGESGTAKRVKGRQRNGNMNTNGQLDLQLKYDPEDYYQAKKKLKKAVLECYRGLEILNNYRTLNLIGFRKALKKFEKVAKIPAQQAYTVEKIEPNAFASSAVVQGMLKELENLYAARFTHGDKKRAVQRLRGGIDHRNHHFGTFRSGLFLGLAIPALVDGLYLSFQPDTREAIPAWDGLLFVYSIFLVPVVFALLVGLNLQVWAASRINYVFIFELDLRTKLDHREYYEMPAFLFSTLCYAFWLSFARIGSHTVSPTIWPLLWLLLAALYVINPLPLSFKASRWWLVRNVGRLLTSGTHRVEFTDFWMGDQFCSLVFTLSNLYFVACAYSGGLDVDWQRCTSKNQHWGVPFVLAALPLLVRTVQSIKRWFDSRLITHLINGGKYATGILYYLFYFNWRHQGGADRGGSFVVWCLFGTLYSVYAAAWDLLMDWSLLRPHVNPLLLRPELLYRNVVPVYYFAIITNVLIRFIWIFYIPEKGPDFLIRTFIAGMLEALRRWQWNFFRLENEHLGNVDQYRVTREVPLPYSFDDAVLDSDDEDERKSQSNRPWRKAQKARANGEDEDSSDQTQHD